MWNENSQVYQLDFGGRVTQESAKNFQIEFRGKQVCFLGANVASFDLKTLTFFSSLFLNFKGYAIWPNRW